MLVVKNGRVDGFIGKNKIYIGRYNKHYGLSGSPLANLFTIGKDGTREEVVEKFSDWLLEQIKKWKETGKETPPISELLFLSKLEEDYELVCWCKPQACHGDIIVNVVNQIRKEDKNE